MRILLYRAFGFRTHTVYRVAASLDAVPEDIGKLMRLVGQTDVDKCDVEQLRVDPGIHFVKTHDLPDPQRSPAIALVRDGRDSVVSYAYFRLKTEQGIDSPSRETFEEKLEEVITGDAFGGWSANVGAWLSQVGPEGTIRYEDLIRDPEKMVSRSLARLGLATEVHASAPSFQELHTEVPWFFRQGTSGSWQRHMPKYLERLFLEKHGRVMAKLGYV